MSRPKILYISHSSRIGGAEVCLLTLVKHLDQTRFEPVVVCPTSGPLRKQVAALGIRTYITPLEWWLRAPGEFRYQGSPVMGRVEKLLEIIRQEQPQLVHSNTSVIWEGALAARLAGVPHLWHLHEILAAHPVLRSLLPLPEVYGIMGALSQQVATVSQAVRAGLEDAVWDGAIDAAQLAVIPNGIELDEPGLNQQRERGPTLRDELKVPSDAVLSITVGSLVPEKGHEVLLQAASLVRQRGVPVHFVIVGGGQPAAVRALRRQIRELGLGDWVHYLGFRRDVKYLLRSSSFFVLPSHTDAFPLAILEAMSAGKPVIATASGGAQEMLVNGESGLLVPVADAAQLATKIIELAEDDRLRIQMGASAFVRFRQHYTASAYVSNFQHLYQQILTQPTGPPLDAASVQQWITRYETLYRQAQDAARQQSPIAWQAGKLLRSGKRLARHWMYERE